MLTLIFMPWGNDRRGDFFFRWWSLPVRCSCCCCSLLCLLPMTRLVSLLNVILNNWILVEINQKVSSIWVITYAAALSSFFLVGREREKKKECQEKRSRVRVCVCFFSFFSYSFVQRKIYRPMRKKILKEKKMRRRRRRRRESTLSVFHSLFSHWSHPVSTRLSLYLFPPVYRSLSSTLSLWRERSIRSYTRMKSITKKKEERCRARD